MMELWPFTNFHDLNLDWIIRTIKTYTKKVDDFTEDMTNAWDTFRNYVNHEIAEMHRKFAIYVNVTEEALNTGAIADGAITKPKIDSDFLKEIENGYVTPEMFGAAGNGVTDDTQAVQAAVTYGVDNGIPILMANTYVITDQIDAGGYIFGNGTLKTMGDATRFEGAMLSIENDVTIDGITFDCKSTYEFTLADKFTRYNNAIIANGAGAVTVRNCVFKNLYNVFISWENSGSLTVIDSIFDATNRSNSHYAACMSLSSSSDNSVEILIKNNVFLGYIGESDDNDNAGGIIISNINCRGITIDGNHFENLGRYGNNGQSRICVIDAYYNVSDLNIANNEILNCNWNAIRLHGCNHNSITDNKITMRGSYASEWVILVSDAKNSTGEGPVGTNDIQIRNNDIDTGDYYVDGIIWVSGVSSFGTDGNVEGLDLIDNIIKGGASSGMFVFDTTFKSGVVKGNVFEHNRTARESTNVIVYKTNGVYDTDLNIEDNNIDANGVGAWLTAGVKAILYNNHMKSDNGYSIRGSSDSDEVVAVSNYIEGYAGIREIGKAYNNIIDVSYTSGQIVSVGDSQNNYVY